MITFTILLCVFYADENYSGASGVSNIVLKKLPGASMVSNIVLKNCQGASRVSNVVLKINQGASGTIEF